MSDQPTGDDERDNTSTDDGRDNTPIDPDHPDEQADLEERGDGAHAENVTERQNFRADETAPGVDPDDGEA